MQNRHQKYAITLFGLGVAVLHPEHPQAINRLNVSSDPLWERSPDDSRPDSVANALYGGNRSPSSPSAAETKRSRRALFPGESSIKSLK